MRRRRQFLAALGAGATVGVAGCGGNDDGNGGNGDGERATGSTTSTAGTGTESQSLDLVPTGFERGAPMPRTFTCDGQDASPAFEFTGVPEGTASFAVVVTDPDAPAGPFVHWLLWNVPGDRRGIPGGLPRNAELPSLGGARQGENGAGEVGYFGPCPPSGDDPHAYRFTLYAVDRTLDVPPGACRDRLDEALSNAVLARSTVSGTYARERSGTRST